MCGIAGTLNLVDRAPMPREVLQEMISTLQHRGPDESGLYRDADVGLLSARLSILDLAGGQQPMSNEDDTLWIVFNGEIFNYIELRPGLEAKGHVFKTNSDTEVILHLYEEYGPQCLSHLNGQFSIAIWDTRKRELCLGRDRLGIRPLFYSIQPEVLVFGSEIKALQASGLVPLAIKREALEEVFTFWSPLPPGSAFEGIQQVPAGSYLLVSQSGKKIESYWSLDFSVPDYERGIDSWIEELRGLLIDATQIRLRADVPVGAYLSGGLDSSLIAALVRNHTDNYLDTFSIAFADPAFDEASHQTRMAQYLGTNHQEIQCTYADIAEVFPTVIWHTETPILRTSPAPMYLLSRLVHEHGYKVVLTGEGADEFLAGYDIFKEMRIRRFWARQPDSKLRPLLFQKLYQDIPGLMSGSSILQSFFARDLGEVESPFYSHLIRWENTARSLRFMDTGDAYRDGSVLARTSSITLPEGYSGWSQLAQAQYLEIATFLTPYLLSSQGDRMSLANSVEGRFPFLDHRVVELCNRMPSAIKSQGLNEKRVLRQLAQDYLPPEIWSRTKRPYRAPIQRTFFSPEVESEYVFDMLSPEALNRAGYFKAESVVKLTQKARSGARLSEVDEMALVGVLSTQLLDDLFVHSRRYRPPSTMVAGMKVIESGIPATA